MWRNGIILTTLLALIFCYGYLEKSSDKPLEFLKPANDRIIGTKVAQQAPDFTVTDLGGKPVTLSAFQGKAVVINFWASWCAPCVIEFPQMLALAKDHPDDVVFLFLSQDESRGEMMRFADKMGKPAKLPNVFIAHDQDNAVAQDIYATYKLPETYLLSPSHTIEDKIVGLDIAWDSKTMRDRIAALAAKR